MATGTATITALKVKGESRGGFAGLMTGKRVNQLQSAGSFCYEEEGLSTTFIGRSFGAVPSGDRDLVGRRFPLLDGEGEDSKPASLGGSPSLEWGGRSSSGLCRTGLPEGL